jgi:predicted HicB family RNase H-like nuclease
MTTCKRDGCDAEFEQKGRGRRQVYCSRDCQVKARQNYPNMIHIRLPQDVADRLRDVAEARGVSMNSLAAKGVRDYLDQLTR